MSYVDESQGAGDTTSWFAERLSEQQASHDGVALRRWADAVLPKLPSGPVALVSASVEGCVLSGVVAALRSEPTTWQRLNLGRPEPQGPGIFVVVEPARLSEGVLEFLRRVLPDALVLDAIAAPDGALASAA
jgi:hypothetical protein